MDMLKLVALDEEDLAIVSAHVQDAVMKVEDLDYAKASKQFILAMNRFAWEAGGRARRRAAADRAELSRACCRSRRRASIPRKKDEVLSLLAIRFVGAAEPAGSVELVFAGDGADPARRRMHRGAAHRSRRRLERGVAPVAPGVS